MDSEFSSTIYDPRCDKPGDISASEQKQCSSRNDYQSKWRALVMSKMAGYTFKHHSPATHNY